MEKTNSITILALGAVAYFTERGIVLSRDWVIHTYQVRSQLNDLQLEVMHAEPSRSSSRHRQILRFLMSEARQVLSLQSRVQKKRCSADLPS